MKKIVNIVAFLLVTVTCFCQNVANCPEEGYLKKALANDKYENYINLKIIGQIGDKDFKIINKLKNLEVLDLSEADVVDCNSFPNLPKLREIHFGDPAVWAISVQKQMMECSTVKTLYMNVLGYLPFPNVDTIYTKEIVQGREVSKQKEIEALIVTEKVYNDFFNTVVLGSSFNGYHPRYLFFGKSRIPNYFDKNKKDYSNDEILLPGPHIYSEHPSLYGTLDLKKARIIGSRVFQSTSITRVILSPNIKYISEYAFSDCKMLKEIIVEDGDNSLVIDAQAFAGCVNLKRATFGTNTLIASYAFDNECIMENVLFKKNAEVQDYAFGKLEEVTFNRVPSSISPLFASEKTRYLGYQPYPVKMIIPIGTTEEFIKRGFDKTNLIDGSIDLEYNITLDRGNSILSKLPVNDLNRIKKLTVTGVLYPADLEIINKCTNLEYLDIRHTFVTFSPEELKAEQERLQALSSIFSMISGCLDAQYENREIGTGEYASSKIIAELVKDASSVKSSDPVCLIPDYSISKLRKLVTLKLPYRAKSIGDGNFCYCSNLKEIEWPLYLKSIGRSFTNCTKLTELHLPSTVSRIATGARESICAFKDCENLKVIDLSNCTFYDDRWFYMFQGVATDAEIHLPQGITNILRLTSTKSKTYFLPETVQKLESKFRDCTIHFSGKTSPACDLSSAPYRCKIYVPKGYLTSYYAEFEKYKDNRIDTGENQFFEE